MSSESEELQQERDERIAQLEARIHRRGVGVKAPVAVLAMVVGGVLLGMLWKDLAYFFSPGTPLTLGAEGAYRYELLESNRYVQLHGIPTSRGAYGREGEALYVVVGLRESPFLVRRGALPGEEWSPGRPPRQPDQRPFGVRGRLLVEEDAERYREGFKLLRDMGEVQPRDGRLWIVVEGERPGGDKGVLFVALLLTAFILANAALLIRGLRRPRR
ncbi:hypothetical protein [Vitiosangium sp. GDMCC 1.1324]|uniref:hypothetical protein n=1 Tax=Vitiosangium sp. (strain GDMCC 1.1324) TaxID=2138576 RepID=UPI000D387163|nr:hypothetical protein [Vitiosangium sp. GDMCC 1.1324]PTL77452.1 hypothetical protein DAT35_44420 [Vitiosangium sp. GDMCC 1.1324]